MWFLNYIWETDINPSKGKGAMISQKNSLYIDIKFALEKLVCQPPKYIYIYMYVCIYIKYKDVLISKIEKKRSVGQEKTTKISLIYCFKKNQTNK